MNSFKHFSGPKKDPRAFFSRYIESRLDQTSFSGHVTLLWQIKVDQNLNFTHESFEDYGDIKMGHTFILKYIILYEIFTAENH